MAPSQSRLTSALYEMTTQTSKKVLQLVLEWGTPRRDVSKTFYEYLLQVKMISMTSLRKRFNLSQRKKMEKSGDIGTFDVVLLTQCIIYGCDGLAPPEDVKWLTSVDTLEWYVTSIKTRRNEFLHEVFDVTHTEFLRVTEELRDLLNNALERAAEIYNIGDEFLQGILQDINTEINSLRNNPSQATDSHALVLERLHQMVKVEGKRELKKIYREESSFGPASNLLGKSKVHVDKVFTAMEIKQEGSQTHEFIQYSELLAKAEERREQDRKACSVLLIEGPAGVGKTTLTRKVISDWASGISSMETLTDYDFVCLSRCRDEIHSLSNLLGSLMPKTKNKVQSEHDMLMSISNNRLMFIVDGLDEINSGSDRVLREIMGMSRTDDITVLCTTRPNKVHDFKRYVPDNFDIMHVKVLGIEENKREEFVRNYSLAVQDPGTMNKDISVLLWYLAKKDSRMQAHWRFPFNLVLVTILWYFDPQAVNSLTTATELFTKTHELCIKRLLQRLSDHEEMRTVEFYELRDKVKKVMKKLCKEAFLALSEDAVTLSRPSVERLKGACRSLRLPANEVLGAFLIQATSLMGDEEKYSFPHKSMQNFLSAMHVKEIVMADEVGLNIPEMIDGIENILSHQEVPQNISSSLIDKLKLFLVHFQRDASRQLPSILSILEDAANEAALYTSQETKLDLVKYQNILIHLTGLLHLEGKTLSKTRARELVELLKATGIQDTSQWLDLLSEVKCNGTVIELLAEAMDLIGIIWLTDGLLAGFLCVLSHACPSPLILDISGDPEDIPCLSDLLRATKDKTWRVWLRLHYDFRHPRAGGSVLEEALQQVFRSGRLQVTRFKGQLSGSATAALPSSLEHLYLAVRDEDHARALLPALSSLPTRLPRLGGLGLHVGAGLDAASLRPLPDVEYSLLWVSGVEEATVEGASRVVAALQPPEGYFMLHFPGALRDDSASFYRLVKHLCQEGVRVMGGVSASPKIDKENEERLEDLVRRELGCGFGITLQTSDEIRRVLQVRITDDSHGGGEGFRQTLRQAMGSAANARRDRSHRHTWLVYLRETSHGRVAGGLLQQVHRLILSMRSPVFEDLLLHDAENKGNVVPLKDDSPAAMHWLLNHIYSDKREIESIDLALQVLGLADKYMVASAYDTCMRYLQTIVKRNNVLKIYKHLVHLFSDNESLRSLCRRVFMDNGNAVLLSQSLLDLSPEALSQLLQEPLRVTSEAVILKALVSWGNAQLKLKGTPNTPENLRQEIRPFLPEIRFFTMTSDEFVQSVVTADVLSPEESVFVLKHIAKPSGDASGAVALNLNPSREDRSSLISKDQMRTCVCEGVSKSWLRDSSYTFHFVPDDNIVLLALKIQLNGGSEEIQLEIRKEEAKSAPLCTMKSRGNNITFKNPVHLREAVTYVFTLHTTDAETALYGAKFARKEYEENGFHIAIGPGIFIQAVVFI